MATWDLRLGALLCRVWAPGVLTGQGCLRPTQLTVPAPPTPQYFILLLLIFLLEVIAGILAYIYYQQVRGLDRPRGDAHTRGHRHTRGNVPVQGHRWARETGTHAWKDTRSPSPMFQRPLGGRGSQCGRTTCL